MKLSNKILITFALALILIPLTGMIYVSRVYYKEGNDRNLADVVRKVESFSTPTENMESKAIATSFESINIEDAKEMGIYVNIIKDEKFGVKIPKELKDLINFNVDANGELQITFKNKRAENDNSYNTIWVYAPNIKQVIVTNANSVNLDAKLDSLTLNVKKSGSINLQNDLTLMALTINTEEVKDLYISNVDVKSLNVKLNGTDFKTQNNSYENLSIAAYGKSNIEISSYEDKSKAYAIKNLTINTFDLADVKVENMKVDNCKGSFSDQTTVQMPAVNLNQMYKK